MITGVVSGNREPMVPLVVRGSAGAAVEVEARIDTGFDGFLTLPPAVVELLGLSWKRREQITTADGGVSEFETYDGVVVWDGRPRRVVVDSTDVDPLVGTRLLDGFRLTVDFRPGGRVTVAPIPPFPNPAARGIRV